MTRRFEQVEERAKAELAGVKALLKRLADRQRAHVLAWLCVYYRDDGRPFAEDEASSPRRRIALDGVEYWLVQVPKRMQRDAREKGTNGD